MAEELKGRTIRVSEDTARRVQVFAVRTGFTHAEIVSRSIAAVSDKLLETWVKERLAEPSGKAVR